MASTHISARRGRFARRALITFAVAGGVVLAPLPAVAAPGEPTTSAEAASLVAERAHELEVVTEQFNDAREALKTKQAEADAAEAQVAAAETALTAAREQIRDVARSAYTGDNLSTLQAMLSSDSADQMLDRMGTLGTIASHNNELLAVAEQADDAATKAKDAAEKAAADAQAQVDAVTSQQADLNAQIAEYQAQYDRLNAAEQEASRAEAERAHASQSDDSSSSAESSSSSAASSSDEAEAAPAGSSVVANSAAAQIAVDTAMAQRGDPYVWAAAGPSSFDCSGLVQYAYAAAGISLPHSSRSQASMGTAVSRDQLQPGDIIAFYSPVSHVGIYIGNGQMVHAPTSGDVVKVASIDVMGSITAMRRIAG